MLAALVMFVLIGMGAAAVTETDNVTFNFIQGVTGDGFFMTYKYIELDGPHDAVSAKDYSHGSGHIESDVIVTAESVDRYISAGGEITNDEYACIEISDDTTMLYLPKTIAIGTGYYAANPIHYDSLLKEKTWVKNYHAVSSIEHEIEYAHAVSKDLHALVKDKNYNYTDPLFEGVGTTQMEVDEQVTEGKIHIGVLQGNPSYMNSTTGPETWKTTAWKDPLIEIDEDYIGTFDTFTKNMSLVVPYRFEKTSGNWLTCCFAGMDDMDAVDTKWLNRTCFEDC